MDKRIKILALSYLFPNKIMPNHGIFVLNRLKALSKYVDIKVINPVPWFPMQGIIGRHADLSKIPQKEIIGGLEVYHPRFFSIPKYFKSREGDQYLKAIRPLIEEIYQQFQFEIIDMHWTFPDLPAGLEIAKIYNIKSMLTLRGMEAFHFQDKDNRKKIVQDGLISVDKVIALSQELMKTGEEISGYTNKSVVIRNGVDTTEFYYLDTLTSKERVGIDKGDFSILTVGSIIYRKGFDLLVRVIFEIKKKYKDQKFKLYIVGSAGAEGDFTQELRQLINQYNLDEEVIFVGQVNNDDLRYWYNASDLFCLASRGEGSPNVLSEALACGCPAVTTDVGCAREIIETEDNLGICVKPDDFESLYNGIVESIGTKYNRELNSKKYSSYDWDWCARKVVPEYQQLLKNHND